MITATGYQGEIVMLKIEGHHGNTVIAFSLGQSNLNRLLKGDTIKMDGQLIGANSVIFLLKTEAITEEEFLEHVCKKSWEE